MAYLLTIPGSHRLLELDRSLLRHRQPLDVLVVGGSHAQNAVEPSILGNSLNVAVAGEHYLKSSYRVPWLLDRHPARVQVVVLPFDHVAYSGWKADTWEPERIWGRYVDWYELGTLRGDRWSYMARWTKANWVPYAGELNTIEQRIMHTRGFKQHGSAQQPARMRRRDGIEVATTHFGLGVQADPTLIAAQRRLIADLRHRDIEVVLVSFPVDRLYFETATALGAVHPRDNPLLQALLEDPNVHYFDFSELFLDDTDRFYDADHLSAEGRMTFSWTLRRELVNLGLLSRVGAP